MLKHPEITRNRLNLFYNVELAERIIEKRYPLSIEISDYRGDDGKAAAKSKWSPVEAGFRYGPAYATFWFRVAGDIPAEAQGKNLGIQADIGGERTIWNGASPYCGMDHAHEVFPWPTDWSQTKAELLIEVYTRNPQHRVHLKELPREDLVEQVEKAELVVIDKDLSDLAYDFDFSRNLLDTIEATDPSHAVLLRALNGVVNAFSHSNRDSIARCRKIIREALATLPGALRHRMTAVGHAHLDTAWLWPIAITHKKMAHTTANQLRLMERYPEYVFVHSQASQYEWLEQEHPALLEEIKEAIKRGQWEPVGSMWVEADCNLSGGESLVRQFLYGRRYFREKLGYETKDMWLPDVFGYSAALPQILAKFGIEFFLTQKISWNQTNRFPHNTFWWQGIDGTKVWTHFPPADTYCGNCEPKEIVRAVKNHQDHARSDASLYVFGFGDGGGGPTERHIEFLRRGRMAPNYPEIQPARKAIDFFRDAKTRSRDLMTWAGELYFEYHRGTYTSQAANKKANRVSEFLLRDAEWLSCFTKDFPTKYPAEELEKAWKLVLLNQFHDIIPGSSVHEVYVDSAKDYKVVKEIGERTVHESLTRIAEHFDTRECARPVALFQNAEVVSQGEIPWDEEEAPGILNCGGESHPVQLIEEFGERKLIFATPSSALGTVALGDLRDESAPNKGRPRASTRKLESDQWTVRFDPNGNITSIQSIEDGTEFLEPGKFGNLFQLFEDKPLFWSAWDIDPYVYETGQDLLKSDSFEVVEKGPVRAAVQLVKHFGNGSRIRQRISLGPTPGIRFDTEVDWHEEDKLLKVGFPLNLNTSRTTCEIQFGAVERPTHGNTSWDWAKFEICAQKWIDMSEGSQGVALLNDSKYGHDVKGNLMRLSLLKAPKAPDPEADMGLHRFTYVIYPHFFGHADAGVSRAAYALNAPLRYAFLDRRGGENGVLPPLLECDDPNIVVETVKKAEIGSGIIVRVYERHNCRGVAELSCLRHLHSVKLCDLEECEIDELEVVDGKVRFDYKPFEIITLKLGV